METQSIDTMEIPDELLSMKSLTDGEKVTLVSLYRYAGRDDLCVWPSNRTISERTGHALRTTQKHLERLEELALIHRSNGAKREIILVYPTSHGAPPTPEETSPHVSRGTPPRLTGREPHYRNQPINQPVNQESVSDDQPDLFPDEAREPREPKFWFASSAGPSLESLWARHDLLRKEAQSALGKPAKSLTLTATRRKALKALLAAGHSESDLIEAWSQSRNDAIKSKSMQWFNGATELRPNNVSRLSGQYEGATAESAKNSNGHIVGGNRGWGTAMVAGAGGISEVEQARLKRDDDDLADLQRRTEVWEMERDHVIVARYDIKTVGELYARRRILTPAEIEERSQWTDEMNQPPT